MDSAARGWVDSGWGVHLLRRPGPQRTVISSSGKQALACISVPLALVQPHPFAFVWKNPALEERFSQVDFDGWVAGWAAVQNGEQSPLSVMLQSIVSVCVEGGCVDIFIPKSISIPYIKQQMPYSWSLHCHAVTLVEDGQSRDLVTMQAPAMIEPPREPVRVTETGMDRVIRLIDRALDNVGGEDSLLKDLRQRVLDGRMNEPVFSSSMPVLNQMSWETSASLAMMLGLPLDATQ